MFQTGSSTLSLQHLAPEVYYAQVDTAGPFLSWLPVHHFLGQNTRLRSNTSITTLLQRRVLPVSREDNKAQNQP